MESEFLVKIPGKGLLLKEIAFSYLVRIEDDFNMTIDEMANYLRCSYDYVQKNIAPYIHHIYINSVANKALTEHDTKGVHTHLFTKRKLFSRRGFQEFLLKESVLLVDRNRYYIDELSMAAREKLDEIAKNQEKEMTTLEAFRKIATKQVNRMYSKIELKDKRVENVVVNEMPVELYSLKDFLEGIEDLHLKFKYKVLVYRYLEGKGVPKIKVQSLVRYRKEDVKQAVDMSFPLIVDREKLLLAIENEIELLTCNQQK